MKKLDHSYFAGGNIKWSSYTRKTWQFIAKLNKYIWANNCIILWDIYRREMKTYSHVKTYTWIFIAVLFLIARIYKTLKCSSMSKWLRDWWWICIMKYYLAIKRNYWYNFSWRVRLPGHYVLAHGTKIYIPLKEPLTFHAAWNVNVVTGAQGNILVYLVWTMYRG